MTVPPPPVRAAISKTLQRGDVRLSYTTTGSGPAVLLVQGVGLWGEGWRPQIDGLAGQFKVVSFDNRGIGASALGAERLTIDVMADDALAIMDAEGIASFHLAGHSMGGIISQQIALSAPQRVKSLALLCTFFNGRQGARLTGATLVTALRTRIGTRRMRRNAFMELVMPPAALAAEDRGKLAERLALLFGRDLADQPAIVMQQLRAMSRYDASDRLPKLAAIPTLVVSASEDRIALPAYGRQLASAIPGARFVEIQQAGHGVPIHGAGETNRLLLEHFNRAL